MDFKKIDISTITTLEPGSSYQFKFAPRIKNRSIIDIVKIPFKQIINSVKNYKSNKDGDTINNYSVKYVGFAIGCERDTSGSTSDLADVAKFTYENKWYVYLQFESSILAYELNDAISEPEKYKMDISELYNTEMENYIVQLNKTINKLNENRRSLVDPTDFISTKLFVINPKYINKFTTVLTDDKIRKVENGGKRRNKKVVKRSNKKRVNKRSKQTRRKSNTFRVHRT